MDLTLPVAAPLDLARGGHELADLRVAARSQAAADVDGREARRGDAVASHDDHVQIAVTVGIDGFDEHHPADR